MVMRITMIIIFLFFQPRRNLQSREPSYGSSKSINTDTDNQRRNSRPIMMNFGNNKSHESRRTQSGLLWNQKKLLSRTNQKLEDLMFQPQFCLSLPFLVSPESILSTSIITTTTIIII